MQKKYVTVVSHIHLWRISSMYLFWCKYSHCVSIITESTVLRLLFTHKTHWKCTINLFINSILQYKQIWGNIKEWPIYPLFNINMSVGLDSIYTCCDGHTYLKKKAKILLLYEIKYSINIRWKIQDKKCTWKWKKLPWQSTEIK